MERGLSIQPGEKVTVPPRFVVNVLPTQLEVHFDQAFAATQIRLNQNIELDDDLLQQIAPNYQMINTTMTTPRKPDQQNQEIDP